MDGQSEAMVVERQQAEGKGVLERLGLHRPELRAWAMYDWANSAMVTVVITAVFPLFYGSVASAGLAKDRADTSFLVAMALGIVVSAGLAPTLGAIADCEAIKKRLLGVCVGIGVLAVGGMFFIGRGQWLLAASLYFIANVAATASFVFYDALLPHIANEEEIDRVSTAGYALGYIGGGLVLGAFLVMSLRPGWFGLAEDGTHAAAMRWSFVLAAVWWTVFSIPLFRKVPEPAQRLGAEERMGVNVVAMALGRLRQTLGELRQYKNAFLMLIAFLIYTDGILTIIRIAVMIGKAKGFSETGMIGAIVLTQFIGIPFSFLFGMLAGWIGTKRSIFLGLGVYVVIAAVGYTMKTTATFFVLAGLVGLVQGGTQALSRSLFATMIPRHKSGEFFGFFGVVEKFAGAIGVALTAVVNMITGRIEQGTLVVPVLFVIGALMLMGVNVKEGQRVARETEGEGAQARGGRQLDGTGEEMMNEE